MVTAAAPGTTADRILDAALRLVQTRGFNGFSFADVSGELGLRKASIHHHFASKADLGLRLLERYHEAFLKRLLEIDRAGGRGGQKLRAYAGLFAEVLRQGDRMCLCGMLAADFNTLPGPIRDEVRSFFDANERWLAAVLSQGRKDGSVRFQGPAAGQARVLLSGLEGAMLIARSYGDPARFEETSARFLASLHLRGRA